MARSSSSRDEPEEEDKSLLASPSAAAAEYQFESVAVPSLLQPRGNSTSSAHSEDWLRQEPLLH